MPYVVLMRVGSPVAADSGRSGRFISSGTSAAVITVLRTGPHLGSSTTAATSATAHEDAERAATRPAQARATAGPGAWECQR